MSAALTPGGRCYIYAQYDYRNCKILAVGDGKAHAIQGPCSVRKRTAGAFDRDRCHRRTRFLRGSRIVFAPVAVRRASRHAPVVERRKSGFDRDIPPLSSRGLRRQHDLQTVQGVFRLVDGSRSGGDALDEVPQAGGPWP